jgi:hypothetical protein
LPGATEGVEGVDGLGQPLVHEFAVLVGVELACRMRVNNAYGLV